MGYLIWYIFFLLGKRARFFTSKDCSKIMSLFFNFNFLKAGSTTLSIITFNKLYSCHLSSTYNWHIFLISWKQRFVNFSVSHCFCIRTWSSTWKINCGSDCFNLEFLAKKSWCHNLPFLSSILSHDLWSLHNISRVLKDCGQNYRVYFVFLFGPWFICIAWYIYTILVYTSVSWKTQSCK